jgi:hypothetical protein
MKKYCTPSGLKTSRPFLLGTGLLGVFLGLGCLPLGTDVVAAIPIAPNLVPTPLSPQLAAIQGSGFTLLKLDPAQAAPRPTNAQTEVEDEADEPQPIPVTTASPTASNTPLVHCSEISTRRYAILVNQPIDSLPQLPEFLTIAAAPCQYFGILMTFFGTFDNAESVTLRADQLRQLKLDAVVHSFQGDVSALNRTYRAYSVIAEMGSNPNSTIQQLQALRFSPQKVNLGNRTVLVVSPSSSLAPARTVSNNLRARGLTTQVISSSLLNRPLRPSGDASRPEVAQGNPENPAASGTNQTRPPRSGNTSKPSGANPNPKPNTRQNPSNNTNRAALPPIPPLPQGKVYRLLIPMRSAETLAQARAIAADAFPRTIQGRQFIQVRSYTDRDNVTRERNRFNERFPGTIVIIE